MEDNRDRLLGSDWIEYSDLQNLTTVSLIDHLAYCAARKTHWLQKMTLDNSEEGTKWAGYRNQEKWCFLVLQERGIYEADPYRDDKEYQYIKEHGS